MTIKLLSMINKKLDILMLNAGIAWVPEYTETEDGFETTMAVNHLNQVHLTNKLMDHIASSGRVIVVSSVFHKASSIEIMTDERLGMDDLKSGTRAWLAGAPAYGDSKLANCVFAKALHDHRNVLAFSVRGVRARIHISQILLRSTLYHSLVHFDILYAHQCR